MDDRRAPNNSSTLVLEEPQAAISTRCNRVIASALVVTDSSSGNVDIAPEDHDNESSSDMSQPPIIHCDIKLGIKRPENFDVICGRGKMTVSHPGNRRFRDMILARKEEYQQSSRRDDKTRITNELVGEVRDTMEGGRFLLYDQKTDLWYDVGDEYAREKISHSLRSRPGMERNAHPSKHKQMKVKKHSSRKVVDFPEPLDAVVKKILSDQQRLLKGMMNQYATQPEHFEQMFTKSK